MEKTKSEYEMGTEGHHDPTPASEQGDSSDRTVRLRGKPAGNTVQHLWVEARLGKVEEWASLVLDNLGQVQVTIAPRPALVMMQVVDSVQQERFCAGELLVTECQIVCSRQRFWGRVLGHQPLRALALATLAAAQNLAPATLEELQPAFELERQVLHEQWNRKARAIGATRVQFDTMKTT
jgi:phosphonate C-P lyase system protein PhnG